MKTIQSEVNCRNCDEYLLIPFDTTNEIYGCPKCDCRIRTIIKNNQPEVTFEISPTLGTICIDFGTSSIRAAVRNNSDIVTPLEIGEAFKSSLDKASIPSAIFMNPEGNEIFYGEKALSLGLQGQDSSIFEISPKEWLISKSLEEKIQSNYKINKGNLLAGLLNHALIGICKCLNTSLVNLKKYELRVSHPVWDHKDQDGLVLDLNKLLSDAFLLGDNHTDKILAKTLSSKLNDCVSTQIFSKVDVIEPIAAALELFSNDKNSREFCIIIDVGAGTTDMASFLSVTPDRNKTQRKLIRLSNPISIYKAGDLIDAELIKLIKHKNKTTDSVFLKLLSIRRRQIKESLFKSSKIFEGNAEISLSELEASPAIQEMCFDIKSSFSTLINDAAKKIGDLVNARTHPIDEIKVIFAGGGGKISFLQKAIGRTANFSLIEVPINIVEPVNFKTKLPASHERLAVSLGGTTFEENWPITNLVDLSKSHRAYYL
jgi:hypothetical protein